MMVTTLNEFRQKIGTNVSSVRYGFTNGIHVVTCESNGESISMMSEKKDDIVKAIEIAEGIMNGGNGYKNVGSSDYSKYKVMPWDFWKYMTDPFLADVVKRIVRRKDTDGRMMDLNKIKQTLSEMPKYMMGVCGDRVLSDETKQTINTLIDECCRERNLSFYEKSVLVFAVYQSYSNIDIMHFIINKLIEIEQNKK